MSAVNSFPLIAVDVGNARIKAGYFDDPHPNAAPLTLPAPKSVLSLSGRSADVERLAAWLADISDKYPASSLQAKGPLNWSIASVNRPAATRLIDWLRDNRPGDSVNLLSAADLPLRVALKNPDQVGVDRLVDAVAANRLRPPQSPAVVVDVGTAITVDLVSDSGVFLGGAILPGIAMAARALHEFTDLLPLVEMSDLDAPPPAVGTATEPAIRSGLFWGAVGSIRQLVEQMTGGSRNRPQVILSGGAAADVAALLGRDALHVPHLTLAGIAISSWP